MKLGIKKIFLELLLLFIIIFASASYLQFISSPPQPSTDQVITFTINRGESIDSIAQRLKQTGLIKSKAAFKITIARLGLSKKIQAGEFQLSPSWPITAVAESLTLGRDDVEITLIEGWRREEIADQLEKGFQQEGTIFNKQQFLLLTQDLEGYLFPDTYFFSKSTTPEQVVQTLNQTFQKKVDQNLRSKFSNQGLSLEQAIIFASMVEREVHTQKDRPVVAGILIKRYKNNWPIQADATVQYALGYQPSTDSWWKQTLTKQDINFDSPYNTYKYPGLPPAPICNPSLASIQAVADQVSTEYWFYLSDLKGNIHYAQSIEQHNHNIAQYLNK